MTAAMTRPDAPAGRVGGAGASAISAAWPVVAVFVGFLLLWKAIVVVGDLPVFILPAPEQVA